MLIRKMELRDLPQVRALCEELGYPVKIEELTERFKIITASPIHYLAVAESETSPLIGFIHASTSLALTDQVRAEIAGLIVTAKARRQGLGRLLVHQAEDWAKTQGHSLMRVRSQALRETAHEFYKDLGYDLRKIQNVFVKNLDQ